MSYFVTSMGVPIPGIRIIVDQYLPGPTQIKHPNKGPYFKRRQRRMQKDPKNWTAPTITVLDGVYYCHPSAFEALRVLIARL